MSTANSLPLAKIVTISVVPPPAGLSAYNVNNLAIFTKETPVSGTLGDFTVYMSPDQVGADWGLSSETYAAALNVFAQTPNILDGGGSLIVAAMGANDTIVTMHAKIAPQIFYGAALLIGYQADKTEMEAGAAVFEAARRLLFLSSNDTAELTTGNAFYDIQGASQRYVRCLLYTVSARDARLFAAAYAGRGMATNWAGANTASSQQLKDLSNLDPDPGITLTILDLCETIGVDVYANFGTLAKVFSTGGNTFFDQVWGEMWLVYALQVAAVNVLAQTPTKVPQTEEGVAELRNSVTGVLQQGVINGFLAPGEWNGAVPFGLPAVFKQAIRNLGFYVFSIAVAAQSQTDRAARKAPAIQAAGKTAGAIHSAGIVVNIEP